MQKSRAAFAYKASSKVEECRSIQFLQLPRGDNESSESSELDSRALMPDTLTLTGLKLEKTLTEILI